MLYRASGDENLLSVLGYCQRLSIQISRLQEPALHLRFVFSYRYISMGFCTVPLGVLMGAVLPGGPHPDVPGRLERTALPCSGMWNGDNTFQALESVTLTALAEVPRLQPLPGCGEWSADLG